MLGATFGGRVAALSAAQSAGPSKETVLPEAPPAPSRPECRAELREILLQGLGIVRTAKEMQKAEEQLALICKAEQLTAIDRSRALLGLAMLQSALARQESRGAHYREDYPERDEAFRKLTLVTCENGGIRLRFVSVDAGEVG